MLILVFSYYSTTATTTTNTKATDDVGRCGTCSVAQDTSNDVSWAVGTFLFHFICIFNY